MATQIEEDIPELPIPPYKNVDSGATFVTKAEAFRQALKDGFQPAMNYVINKINIISNEVSANSIIAENSAIIATGLANFQGVWSKIAVYDKGQSVESTTGSKIYYISKVDSNLNHAITDTNYWLYSPINDKLDKDFSILTDKATPSDADILAIGERGGLLKKLSWANLKATLKTYFDSLYMSLTGNQTISGTKFFSAGLLINSTSGILGYTDGSGASVTQLTNKNTPVSCPSPTGTIVTSNSLLNAGHTAQFTVFCNSVNEHSTVQVNCKYTSGIGLNYSVDAISANGSFVIRLENKSQAPLSEYVYITYTILKGTLI